MAIVSFREDELPDMTEEREAELRSLAQRPDSEIDYSDIPPATDEQLTRMKPWNEAMAEWREQNKQTALV
jgi:hypothetical protein